MSNYFTIMVVMLQISRLNGERTTNSILHILNGKRSSQTIIDIQLYHLSTFFGLYEKMSRKEFDEIIEYLKVNRWITSDSSSNLTALGQNKLDKFIKNETLAPTLDGWNYHHLEKTFFQKLTLLIQVLSNSNAQNKSYIPIIKQKKVQLEIKQLLSNQDKSLVAQQFYEQLTQCLEQVESIIDPSYVVIHLSGYQKSGKTMKQAMQYFDLPQDKYIYFFKSCLHAMLREIISNKVHYSCLFLLLQHEVISPITSSTIETETMLQKGMDIERIAAIRNLKISTIEDHLVELAMFREDFPMDHFISSTLQQDIIRIVREQNTKKLKQIKDRIAEATYFQIRLVVAREGMS